ncbi:PA14 domain-containing protein, partial [Verrucomicrobia bacterium]|nr:PA14 domain-containing protein [Verrucomicrobiota bacterium]
MLMVTGALSQESGIGYVNYKTYKTHSGNGSSSTYGGVTYSVGGSDHAEMDAIFDVNQPGTTLISSGTVSPLGAEGLNGGHPPGIWGPSFFGVVFTGMFQPSESGTYKFRIKADDSHEFWITGLGDSNDLITQQYGCCSYIYGEVTLDSNTWYQFGVRYQEYGGGDYINMYYILPSNYGSSNYNAIDENFGVFRSDTISPPSLTGVGGTLSFTENGGATAIDASLSVGDVDDTNLESATITITSGYVSSEDVLGFSTQNGISGSWNSGSGVMTLSGTSSLSNYETALESVSYNNTSEN